MKAWSIPMSMNFYVKLFSYEETDRAKTEVLAKMIFGPVNITQCKVLLRRNFDSCTGCGKVLTSHFV